MKLITLCLLLIASVVCGQEPVVPLDDYRVYHVNSAQPIEPSGLTFKGGKLYTVCDDANVIFSIKEVNDREVEAVVHQSLDASQLAAMQLDLEGITTVGDDFVVVSESNHKLVHIKQDQLAWVPDLGGVYASAYEAGLFQINNAGLEAVAYLGEQTFLLSVERQPRGLIEVTFDQQFATILRQKNQLFDDSNYPLSAQRKPDLTGLFVHDGRIFALHRNAYLIHELHKNAAGDYEEGKTWSYEHIVKQPEYAYADMTFGHAEGLAVDDDYFYLIIDNNNNPRAQDANDRRPLLIQAKRR